MRKNLVGPTLLTLVVLRLSLPFTLTYLEDGRLPPTQAQSQGFTFWGGRVDRLLIAACLVVSIHAILSCSRIRGNQLRVSLTALALFVPYLTAAIYNSQSLTWRLAVVGLVVVGLVVSADAISDAALAIAASLPVLLSLPLLLIRPDAIWFGDRTTVGWRSARFAGSMEQPNVLAAYCGLAIVIAFVGSIPRRPRAILLVVNIAALALTASYTTFIATALTIYLLRRRGIRWRSAVAIITLSVAAMVRVGSADYLPSNRQQVWKYVGDHWGESSIWGHGSTYWQSKLASQDVANWMVHAHNQILESLMITGLIGCATLGVVFTLTVRRSIRAVLSGDRLLLALIVYSTVRAITEVPLTFVFFGNGAFLLALFVVSATRGLSSSDVRRSAARDERADWRRSALLNTPSRTTYEC